MSTYPSKDIQNNKKTTEHLKKLNNTFLQAFLLL